MLNRLNTISDQSEDRAVKTRQDRKKKTNNKTFGGSKFINGLRDRLREELKDGL